MCCDIAQGYFISKPLSFNELINFLEQDRHQANAFTWMYIAFNYV
jgi:EAL domain-containing protein (putative c-di-GMP-specific phosphodiesterase class I)